MTSTDVAIPTNYDDIAKLTGQGAETSGGFLPFVYINREAVDEHDNPLPVGQFTIQDPDTKELVFAKTISIRPFALRNRVSKYDPDEQKTVSRSVLFDDWRDPIPDSKGGQACGKIMGKAKAGLTPEQIAEQKNIHSHRHLYGLLTMTGITADKREVTFTDLPFTMRVRGANFMFIEDFLRYVKGKKLLMPCFNLDLSLERKKNGSVTYYEIKVGTDYHTKHVPFTADDHVLLKNFLDVIARDNTYIMEAYRTALKGTPTAADKDDEDALAHILGDDEPPFDDEVGM